MPPTTSASSEPRIPPSLGICWCTLTRGSFFWMSMSSTHTLSGFCAPVDERTSTGIPVDCFDQISAIFAPSPNLPRVWRTPYLEPESTRPSISGICSCFMPHPLSRTVTR